VRHRIADLLVPTLRGAALFLAAYTVVGVIGELRGRTTDLSLWWVDLRDLPAAPRQVLLLVFAAATGSWALVWRPPSWLRVAVTVATGTLTLFVARDVIRFYAAIGAGDVRPWMPIPLSLAVTLVLAGTAVTMARSGSTRTVLGTRATAATIACAAGWAILFPLGQMLFFGTTDYRRPADAAVIFGARVYADGRPSQLLADRITTGVQLYRAGLVPMLIMSGGDGSDGFNEALVMRDVAIADGVPDADILVDPHGISTEATVANVNGLLEARGRRTPDLRLIAVSQAYHLPRVQLAFGQAGVDVLTVPAADDPPISEMPLLVAREVPAFWGYYLRICLG
jgi:vancomycin permeability regulator SanA